MPVAPVVVWVILVNAVFIHKVGVEDGYPGVFTFTGLPSQLLELPVRAKLTNVPLLFDELLSSKTVRSVLFPPGMACLLYTSRCV